MDVNGQSRAVSSGVILDTHVTVSIFAYIVLYIFCQFIILI